MLAFVPRPRDLLSRIASALRPGGTFVSHEYFDYATWRAVPRSELFEEFVTAVISNWRKSGGEPDIGLEVPRWLEELGFDIESVEPIIHVLTPRDYMWQWPTSFMQIGLGRLIELGAVTSERGATLRAALADVTNSSTARMITPGVLEVIARKR